MIEHRRTAPTARPSGPARKPRRLPLRMAAALAIAAATAGGLALFMLGLWLGGGWPQQPAAQLRILAIGGGACFAFAAAAVLAWAWFELRVARPLATLARRAADTAAAGGEVPFEPPSARTLGELPEAVAALAARLAKTRHDTVRAMGAAAAESEEQLHLLEAILLDLSEGVVVCGLDHRILLYNRAAVWFFDTPERLGLGRSLFEHVERDAVESTLADLTARERHDAGAGERGLSDAIVCRTAGQGAELRGHMALVRDPAGRVVSYVLTLTARDGPPPAVGGAALAPAADAGFYDFALLGAERTAGQASDRALRDLDYVAFDTETTGLNPSGGDEIVSIGGVRISGGRLRQGEVFDSLVNPGRAIPAFSRRVHGIDDVMVADAPGAAQVLPAFRDFVGNAVLVAHNAAFDMRFLTLKEAQTGAVFDNPVLDTLLLSVFLAPEEPDHTLEGVAERVGVEIGPRHSALGDALTAGRIFLRQIELLQARGVTTLGEAVEASRSVVKARKVQGRSWAK